MSRLLFRADAGRATGVGHVMRCLAIAETARSGGDTVAMSGSVDDVPWLSELLAGKGIELLEPATSAQDLLMLGARTKSDAIVVDHYQLTGDLSGSPIPVASMVDGNFGARPADLLVDPGLGAVAREGWQATVTRVGEATSAGATTTVDGGPPTLQGPRYAPVRASVRAARLRRVERRVADPTPWADRPARILLVLGGTDPLGLTRLVASALRHLPVPATVTVVVAPGQVPAYEDLAVSWQTAKGPASAERCDGLRLVAPGPQLPELAADADVVVSAAGTTTHELCHIGVPGAIICVADNQRRGYDALVAAKGAVGLGDAADVSADPSSVTAAVAALLRDPGRYQRMSVTASGLVDGQGGQRILDALGRLTGSGRTAAADERRLETR
ncbi:N/A [soil metagenome]